MSIRYKVESIAGNILCWVKKPDYTSIRKKLIKSKCIDDNTGFTILNLRSKDIFISKSDNAIMIVFQDFKQIFNIDKMFSLEKLKLTRNLDQLDLLSQLGCLTDLNLSNNNKLTNIPKPHALYSLRTTPCGLRDFGRQGCGLNPTTLCVNRVEPQGGAKRPAREGHIPLRRT